MQNLIKVLRSFIIISLCTIAVRSSAQVFTGRVLDSADHMPLAGVTVSVKGSAQATKTDAKGVFELPAMRAPGSVLFSFIGYKTLERKLTLPLEKYYNIILQRSTTGLNEITVSTGYQQLPAERATGSFAQVDNETLHRRVGTDVLSKLEDVTPGLTFNRSGGSTNDPISIRGRSTLFGNPQPLIVLDNFPYDGDPQNINPNDIESVTILKDAAAASIWGARAGNGVIVLTSKMGKFNRPLQASFNSSVTIGDKPDVFYQPRMSSSDFIDIEKLLFSQGFYKSTETSVNNKPLTPVVELLIAARDGKISNSSASAQIDALRNVDVRQDFERYFYQKSLNQQYAFNISGGSADRSYYLSAGNDLNRDNLVNNGYRRTTLNFKNTFSFFNRCLELSDAFLLASGNIQQNDPGIGQIGLLAGNGQSLFPYARLADADGNALAITHDYRASFVSAMQQKGFLNWQYKPLDEIRQADNHTVLTDYTLNFGVNYKVSSQLAVQVLYQYERGVTDQRNLQSQQSYYTRDLINKYTIINSDGSLSYPVPLGGILDQGHSTLSGQTLRGQLNYNGLWHQRNDKELTAIAGYEIKDVQTQGYAYRQYGYNSDHATGTPVNYTTPFTQSFFPADAELIPNADNMSQLTDRFISYYANGAYTMDGKYSVSASGRLDRSNIFGVRTNQQGVPLYSVGLAWTISKESFYRLDWLPEIKLRATYGYNGNVDKNLSAYTTATYIAANAIGLPYAIISNPPNDQLRWERNKVVNFGVDFRSSKNLISGSLEYYVKNGIDLIGTTPYPASSGITSFTGNTANTAGHGVDLTINTRNIDRTFKWISTFLFSYTSDVVTSYKGLSSVTSYVSLADQGAYPLEGKPLFALYSYKWAGLNPQTGDPQGYLNGVPSTNYTALLAAATPANLVYSGSSRPVSYGAFRNTFSYRNFSVSANIAFRLNYFFRRNGIAYATVLKGTGYMYGDFAQRWQKPGDEQFTQVPSLPAAANANRDNLYRYSDILVERADNIRLRDINISYELTRNGRIRLPVRSVTIFLYGDNLGILWKATRSSLDPDYANAVNPPVKTFSAGLKVNL